MDPKIEYVIEYAPDIQTLEERVNRRALLGFVPQGGISMSAETADTEPLCAQALVRHVQAAPVQPPVEQGAS